MIKAHTGGVRCVAFSPDSTSLLSASDDKTIKMWSIAGHKFKQTLSGHSNWVRAARFSPAGPRPPHLSCCPHPLPRARPLQAQATPGVESVQDLTRRWLIGGGGWAGDVVVSGGDDKTVRIWDLNQRQCVHTFYDHTGPVNDVTFHPDGLCVAACSADNTIKIWDMRMHQLLQVSFLYHTLY